MKNTGKIEMVRPRIRICSFCGEKVRAKKRICPSCGRLLRRGLQNVEGCDLVEADRVSGDGEEVELGTLQMLFEAVREEREAG